MNTCKRGRPQFELCAMVNSEAFGSFETLCLLRPPLEVFGGLADAHFFDVTDVERAIVGLPLRCAGPRPDHLVSLAAN